MSILLASAGWLSFPDKSEFSLFFIAFLIQFKNFPVLFIHSQLLTCGSSPELRLWKLDQSQVEPVGEFISNDSAVGLCVNVSVSFCFHSSIMILILIFP